MNKSALLASISLAATALAGPVMARADDLYIWDTKGVQIGTHEDVETLHRQIGKTWYEISYSAKGLIPDAEFVYQAHGCIGPRYLGSVNSFDPAVVLPAVYEDLPSSGTPASNGKTLWSYALGQAPISFVYGSTWVIDEDPSIAPHCEDNFYYGNPLPFIAAAPVDTKNKGFSPPFCASTVAVRCPAAAD